MSRRLAGLLALAPAVVGLTLAVLLQRDVLPNLVFVGEYYVDAAAFVSLAGIGVTLLLWLSLALRWWADRRVAAARTAERDAQVEARQRFLRRLDHELKNPLTIIRIGVTNLQQSDTLTSDEQTSAARVAQQARRLQQLVEDLRRLAELEAHGLERTPVDLLEVLEEAAMLVRDTPEKRDRTVKLDVQRVPWPLSAVWGDRDLLVVVFRNLLDNALKFTAQGDHVEVRATEDGHLAVVEVVDTGRGIPAEEQQHIFEELYRGQNAREVTGSGLGLALVRRIVRLHDGEIAMRSRVDQGTIVTVRLPVANETA